MGLPDFDTDTRVLVIVDDRLSSSLYRLDDDPRGLPEGTGGLDYMKSISSTSWMFAKPAGIGSVSAASITRWLTATTRSRASSSSLSNPILLSAIRMAPSNVQYVSGLPDGVIDPRTTRQYSEGSF